MTLVFIFVIVLFCIVVVVSIMHSSTNESVDDPADRFMHQNPEDDTYDDRLRRDESDEEQMRKDRGE